MTYNAKLTPEREHELAEALDNYTDPTHPEYDPEFAAKIKKMRPDWFEDERDAREERELAEALDQFTDPSHPEYDADFTATIKRMRPDWF